MTTAASESRDVASRLQRMRRHIALVAALLSAALFVGCGQYTPPLALADDDSEPGLHVASAATAEASTNAAPTNAAPAPQAPLIATPTALIATSDVAAPTPVATAPTPTAFDARWYSPVEADFRAIYDQDAANAKAQTFNDYFGWVKTFYEGSVVAEGWKSRVTKLVDHIRDEETKASLRTALNAFGRRVSGEWAKSGSVRRINTTDILEFGPRLEAAKAKDDGSGAALLAEIDYIRQKIDERFK